MCQIWWIFEKTSLGAPAVTGIGMDNTDNIPDKYVTPGGPAVTSRTGHDTSSRPHKLPNINENESKSMKSNGNQWKSMEINENQWKSMKINENAARPAGTLEVMLVGLPFIRK